MVYNETLTCREIQRRRDFRSECVFTIDPATARDLDDALSVASVGEGVYRSDFSEILGRGICVKTKT